MKKAFIIHGAYGSPEENWIPWLENELVLKGYEVVSPQFPTPVNQNYGAWMEVITPHLNEMDEETVLIGHSIGATFLLCILEKIDNPVGKAILASGFLGLLANKQFDEINETISNRVYNWQKITANAKEFTIIHSDNDPYVPLAKASELGEKLNTGPVVIGGGGHLNSEAGFSQFPLLLEMITE